MSLEEIPTPDTALADALGEDMRQLINHIRCNEAPAETLAVAREAVQAATAALAPWQHEGEGWSTISVGSKSSGLAWSEEDITSIMPYSPVSGRQNPIAPELKLWRSGDEVHGEAIFTPAYAGPPDSVHGGIIAAVFDEVLAMANVISGNAGFTGTLTIRYHSTTPLNEPIELFGVNVRQDGRKQISRGEMRVNGKVTASAEGLFICATKPDD